MVKEKDRRRYVTIFAVFAAVMISATLAIPAVQARNFESVEGPGVQPINDIGVNEYRVYMGMILLRHSLWLDAHWTETIGEMQDVTAVRLASVLVVVVDQLPLSTALYLAHSMIEYGLEDAAGRCQGSGVRWNFIDVHMSPEVDFVRVVSQ